MVSGGMTSVSRQFAETLAGRITASDAAVAGEAFALLEVPRKRILLDRVIGQNNAGVVRLGKLLPVSGGTDGIPIAVKMRSDSLLAAAPKLPTPKASGGALLPTTGAGASLADDEALQLEARLLQHFAHPHIVRVVALVTKSLPTMIALEYLANGDLKTYLRACRPGAATPRRCRSWSGRWSQGFCCSSACWRTARRVTWHRLWRRMAQESCVPD
jgi:hypothetical protein